MVSSLGRFSFRWLFLAYSGLSLLLSSLVLSSWFQEDDFVLLQSVRSGGPFGMWTHSPSQFFRPLVSLTMWVQYQIFGLNPLPFRVFNSLVHAGCAAMVSLLALALLRRLEDGKHAKGVAFASGIIFLVSPVHTEAISWISARTDLLATFFGLWSLLVLVRWVQAGDENGVSQASQPDLLAKPMLPGAVLLFALGLLCKESIIVVPLIAIAYASWAGNRGSVIKVGASYFSVVALYLVGRISMIGGDFSGGIDRNLGFKTVGSTLAAAARCLLPGAPFGDPNLNNSEAIFTPAGAIYLILGLAAVGYILVTTRRKLGVDNAKLYRFLWFSFFAALVPALGLSVRLFRTQGERFVYFPSAFILILLALALGLEKRSGASVSNRRPIALQVVIGLSVGAFLMQQLLWREGAAQSRKVQESFIQDVVNHLPRGAKEVVVVDAPTGVQGSYGVIYALDALGPLFHYRPMHVHVLTALSPRTNDYVIQAGIEANMIRLRSSGDAVFNREATATAMGLAPGKASNLGFPKFEPHEVWIDLEKLPKGIPAYFWDGHSFKLLSAGILRDN